MDYSNFVILLARPRSGTNALRSVVDTHPDIGCFDEVFSLSDRASEDELTRKANFFNFLITYADGDVTRTFPDRHDQLFVDFLDHLRGLSPKRFLLIDVKYTTMHLLSLPYRRENHPYLFDLIARNALRVLHLTRRNYLRSELSELKAVATGDWYCAPQEPCSDGRISVNTSSLLSRLQHCEAEDQMIRRYFRGYPTYLSCDYQDVFSIDTASVAGDFLRTVSAWLGVSNTYANEPSFRKQSYLPLRQTIDNYDEVAAALRGSAFEYCLDDEPSYRAHL